MKKHASNAILILVFLIGLSLLLYPTVSNYWNSLHTSKAISSYAAAAADLDEEHYDSIWQEAQEYNRTLTNFFERYALSEQESEQYYSLLNLDESGVMGYIEISSINVSLPVYHGTSDTVLQTAVGHLEWSSLPVGGESTHCVLSGHRGLPRAKLFTDLDQLVVGDTFVLRILDEILTYEVDQILIVEPHEVDTLAIEPGKDLCTLVTCTPYGINSHRLLVRGHRVANAESAKLVRVTADAVQIDPILVAPFAAMPLLMLLGLYLVLEDKMNKRKGARRHHEEAED